MIFCRRFINNFFSFLFINKLWSIDHRKWLISELICASCYWEFLVYPYLDTSPIAHGYKLSFFGWIKFIAPFIIKIEFLNHNIFINQILKQDIWKINKNITIDMSNRFLLNTQFIIKNLINFFTFRWINNVKCVGSQLQVFILVHLHVKDAK